MASPASSRNCSASASADRRSAAEGDWSFGKCSLFLQGKCNFLLLALKESVRGLQFITVIATVERALSDMPVTVTSDMM